jgi:hypothetical protein
MLQERLSQGEKEQAKLRSQLEDLMSRVPGLRAEILDKLYSRELQKNAAGTQASYLGVAQGRLGLDTATSIDPNTGIPYSVTASQNKNNNAQTLAARKARVGALGSSRDKAYEEAQQLFKGHTVPNPNPRDALLHPKVVRRPNYQQAYKSLYARYGAPLKRYAPKGAQGWWNRQIDAMIRGALVYAGYQKPASQ